MRNLLPYKQASLALAQRCSVLPGGSPLFTAMLNCRHSASADTGGLDENFAHIGGQERTNYPFTISVDDLGLGFALDVQVDRAISAERVLTRAPAPPLRAPAPNC